MVKRKAADKTLYCSFCGNSQYEVRQLIAGCESGKPMVSICNDCVQLCVDILADTDLEAASADTDALAKYVTQQTEAIADTSRRIARAARTLRDKQSAETPK